MRRRLVTVVSVALLATGASFAQVAPSVPNKQFRLLWIGVGKDDTLTGPGDKVLDEVLTKAGVNHTFVLTEGRHEWTVWRHHLQTIALMLFK